MDDLRHPPVGQTELARAVGCRPQTIQHLLDPKKNAQGSKYTPAIANYLAVSAIWLATGKGEPRPNAQTPEEFVEEVMRLSEDVEPGPSIRGKVPLISWVQAGDWNHANDPYPVGVADEWLPCPSKHGARTYALRVRGDSMTAPHGKTYPEGSVIFVDPDQKNPPNGARIIAKLDGSDEVTFKVFVLDAGRAWLKPLNPQHPPIMDQFRILGTVIGKWEEE